jgi:hypothetical protein
VLLVGDTARESMVAVLRRGYVEGYIGEVELERRVGGVLRARTPLELASSVRGIPGGLAVVATDAVLGPAIRRGTFGLRVRAARFAMRLALVGWSVASVVLAAIAAVWALAAGLPLGVGLALLVTWVFASAAAVGVWRGARKLLRV